MSQKNISFSCEKGEKSRRFTVFFQGFAASKVRKVGSLNAAGAEPFGQMRAETRRCGAKHMWKSKCIKNVCSGLLLEELRC